MLGPRGGALNNHVSLDLRDGRLGAVVGKWCDLGGPMERAFLIVARTHSTQPDGAPVELKTLIEYEPHSAAAIRL